MTTQQSTNLPSSHLPPDTQYIGIPKRFLASFIDGIILNILTFVCFIGQDPSQNPVQTITFFVLIALIQWAYYALLESSSEQATLGKMALSLVVVNCQGKKLSLGQATLRYFCKGLWFTILLVASVIALIAEDTGGDQSPYVYVVFLLFLAAIVIAFFGNLMIAFNPERQALHDRIVKTYVIEANDRPRHLPQKALFQIAAIALVAAILFRLTPTTATPPPRPTPTATTIPSPQPSAPNSQSRADGTPLPSPESPPIANDIVPVNLCGIREQTFAPNPNAHIDGVWSVQFSVGPLVHNSVLVMQGERGLMRTEFLDGDRQRAVIQQMRLRSSARGAWLLGSNPVDAETNQPNPNYIPDNLFLQVTPQGDRLAFNCDAQNNRAPAILTFLREKP